MLSSLLSWPGVSRRTLAGVLPDGAPRRARVLDPRFLRPLRALGHTVVATGEKAELVCAKTSEKPAPKSSDEKLDAELINQVHDYASTLVEGGMVILRSTAAERERVAAAFLHAGLRDVEQTRSGRGFLTSGVV